MVRTWGALIVATVIILAINHDQWVCNDKNLESM